MIDNGGDAGKKILVVLGDGYAAGDQATFNTDVDNLVTQGVFGHDFFRTEQNAFNVYRVNLASAVSGVSQRVYNEHGTASDASDDTITSTTMKNTALKIIYSGSWAHCWMEYSGETEAKVQAALTANVSHYDYVLVLLNETGFGGCGGSGRQHVTKAVGWDVVAHEYGHGIGGLWDEYSKPGAYTGGATNNRNCSTDTNRASNFWSRFISPATTVPTTFGGGMDSNRTVGIFEGCGTKTTGIYRPVSNCRMKGNTPDYCPVCQTLMRKALHPNLGHNFANSVFGDFNGDGRDDVLIQNGGDLAIYFASGGPNRLDEAWVANNRVPSAAGSTYFWTLAPGDQFYVADFNGDGKDDVYVLNTTSWGTRWLGLLRSTGSGLETVIHYGGSIPGYGNIGSADQLFVADFNADNKDDLYLFTGTSWSTKYMGLLQSSGNSIAAVQRYDGSIPGWIMAADDKYYVGDLDGDNKRDLYVFNGTDWSSKYLGMLKSSGAALSDIKLYTGALPSGWNMGAHDQHYVGDFDGDHKSDLYVFNGQDWSVAYFEMTRSTGTQLAYVKRYDDDAATAWASNIPGWEMKKGDRFFVSDANKDGKADLFVFNPKINWSTEYLGALLSNGTALSGSWSEDWVLGIPGAGGWNLGAVDTLASANYEGGAGKADVFIRNNDWIGLLRRTGTGFVMDRHYFHWIYSPLHDAKPWSDNLP
ncbi:MAG: M64 family metallopeptidase [Thermoanaerobaculia bacterium]